MHNPVPTMHTAAPSAALRPFVKLFWRAQSSAHPPATREHVLPTGQMHLVFRLDGPALRVFDGPGDAAGSTLREPVLGGARSEFYVKQMSEPVLSVGVQLLPGAAQALFGVSAAELAGVHTPLSALWGGQADSALNRIAGAGGPREQLAMFDALLCARLAPMRGLHPQVAQALGEFRQGLRIDALVERSCYSHRAFNALFKDATGLSPKRYARLLRFQQLLTGLNRAPGVSLIELALAAGYSDQAHMNREFREFTGFTPGQYRLLAPASANHLTIARG